MSNHVNQWVKLCFWKKHEEQNGNIEKAQAIDRAMKSLSSRFDEHWKKNLN